MLKNDGQFVRQRRWPLGLMVVHSPQRDILGDDLAIAQAIGAEFVELLPKWSDLPDALEVSRRIVDAGLSAWSIHGPWGGQSIRTERVDIADPEPRRLAESLDDVRLAIDFGVSLGAEVIVIHPGGLSEPVDFERRRAILTESLAMLADHVVGSNIRIGVENMPRGVNPGSRMKDLYAIVETINSEKLGLVLDTGHANITADTVTETAAAGVFLISTHLHDNNGRSDTHLPPGHGTINWEEWFHFLDQQAYGGPVMLECVKYLRERVAKPEEELRRFLELL
jgi:sugar phosphate isomerase/epimerase